MVPLPVPLPAERRYAGNLVTRSVDVGGLLANMIIPIRSWYHFARAPAVPTHLDLATFTAERIERYHRELVELVQCDDDTDPDDVIDVYIREHVAAVGVLTVIGPHTFASGQAAAWRLFRDWFSDYLYFTRSLGFPEDKTALVLSIVGDIVPANLEQAIIAEAGKLRGPGGPSPEPVQPSTPVPVAARAGGMRSDDGRLEIDFDGYLSVDGRAGPVVRSGARSLLLLLWNRIGGDKVTSDDVENVTGKGPGDRHAIDSLTKSVTDALTSDALKSLGLIVRETRKTPDGRPVYWLGSPPPKIPPKLQAKKRGHK